ncbi:MAG: heavy metal-associated domain-containing protein, partial [Bacteroidales bacterium]|nr:heavy metal-associated domain-containing protein [Bacteroidales bacterium]
MRKKISILSIIAGLLFMTGSISEAMSNQEEARFWVSMDCNSCKQKILDNISFEKGVKDIIIDLENQLVVIHYNSKKTSPEKLLQAIQKLGFDAKILDKEPAQEPVEEQKTVKDPKQQEGDCTDAPHHEEINNEEGAET